MSENSRAINRVFTRNVFKELIKNGTNEVYDYVVRRYVNDPESKTHGEIINEIYAYLSKEKRNEYYYVNTLLNKLLVGIHNVNTTTALSQLKIGAHIADFVMINGEGRLYEIKTELDNLDRLSEQLIDYFRAFSKVSVLSSVNDITKVEKVLSELGELGDSVGIYCLTKNDTIFNKTIGREPKEFVAHLQHETIFKLLRKQEYESIILNYFGEVPDVAPVFFFKACLEKFEEIPILESQMLAFTKLKQRNKISKEIFEDVQQELKTVVYFSELANSTDKLERFLETTYRR